MFLFQDFNPVFQRSVLFRVQYILHILPQYKRSQSATNQTDN